MKITASQVNELRKKTGSGMMDCKKALVEAEGDMETAIDILRKKGQKVAAKRSDRETGEGLVLANINANGSRGYLVVLGCETDFVAKNDTYNQLTQSFVKIAMDNNPANLEEFNALKYDDKLTVAEKIIEQVGVIGEKLVLDYKVVDAECVVAYNHPGNQIATIVGLNKNGEEVAIAGKQVAMQVASMAPVALNKDAVSAETIARELEVGKELAIAEGKPAEMADKIAQGRLGKFFKENTLMEQAMFTDNKKSVTQFLQATDKDLTVTGFERISLS
ncbi:MAG: translation elongation factor Ts [Flavobacteriales bacterium]|jgi:elongation factor Ts|tara:strand:+ start:4960 stop:5787 length:828 start_codon:yes stop_codon:yes gene_type:complete